MSGKFDYDRIINGPNDNISNKIILLVIKKIHRWLPHAKFAHRFACNYLLNEIILLVIIVNWRPDTWVINTNKFTAQKL